MKNFEFNLFGILDNCNKLLGKAIDLSGDFNDSSSSSKKTELLDKVTEIINNKRLANKKTDPEVDPKNGGNGIAKGFVEFYDEVTDVFNGFLPSSKNIGKINQDKSAPQQKPFSGKDLK